MGILYMMDLSNLPWPYNGMVHDIQVVVEWRANYLVALGLAAYSEVVGCEIMKGKGREFQRFNKFVSEYMGYTWVLSDTKGEVYDWFRNGLAHEYFIKSNRSVVAMSLKKGDPPRPGLYVSPDGAVKAFIVKEYFRDFKAGMGKWLLEKGVVGQAASHS